MEDYMYEGWLEEDSKHSLERAKERAGLNRKRALKMIELAKQRGISSEACRWSLDRNYLDSKTSEEAVAVAFNGFCYILDRRTMNCITLFRLPPYFGKKKSFYKVREEREVEQYA